MARTRLAKLDSVLTELLDGNRLADKVGIALQLVTVDATGVPHPALVSVGEVLAAGDRDLLLALWADSDTTRNMCEGEHALLTVVAGGAFYGIALHVHRPRELPVDGTVLACFRASVRTVHRDEVPYAELTGGISFCLSDTSSAVERWQQTITALRQIAPDATGAQR